MTPRINDIEGEPVPMEALRRMASMPVLRASRILGLADDHLREGEFLRVVFVRGTYFHRDAIGALIAEGGGPPSAALVPEPDNLADQWAVAVQLDGLRVGYIPKELAFDLRSLFGQNMVRIAGMSEVWPLANGYGIALLLASQAEHDPVFPPSANHARAFAGVRVAGRHPCS